MHDDQWVWVVDDVGRRYPYTRDAVALDPSRFRVVENHPVRDSEGRLLPTEFPQAVEAVPFHLAVEATEAEEA